MSTRMQRGPQASGSLGILLVALVVMFTAAGYGLDRWFGTIPWLMVAGVFVGFGLGFTYLVLVGMSSSSNTKSQDEGREDHGDGSDQSGSK